MANVVETTENVSASAIQTTAASTEVSRQPNKVKKH